jgi:hypothetical protein
MKYTDEQLKEAWKRLGDIAINNEEELEEDFIIDADTKFSKGTDRMDIWHWFDVHYSTGVHGLMFPNQFVTTEDFWDCECKHNYIHSSGEGTNECKICGAQRSTSPDSRVEEVKKAGLL